MAICKTSFPACHRKGSTLTEQLLVFGEKNIFSFFLIILLVDYFLRLHSFVSFYQRGLFHLTEKIK